MDSHVFRLLANELTRLLHGARVEKIHGPAPGVYLFTLFARKEKYRLILRCERHCPLLFLTRQAPGNPSRPPAQIMRLRKYFQGRRLGQGIADVTGRRMAFPLALPGEAAGEGVSFLPPGTAGESVSFLPPGTAGESASFSLPGAAGDTSLWLLLDVRNGAEVQRALPEAFGAAPEWPLPEDADALCAQPWSKKAAEGPWQRYAVLTPLLRETLSFLEPLEGRALLVDLESGGSELFLYADASGRPCLYSAWPLPEELCRRKGLKPYELPEESRDGLWRDFPVLSQISLLDEPRFFEELGEKLRKEEHRPRQREVKRFEKLLAKLDREEERLRGLMALRADARALQGLLWRYPAEARLASVSVPPECGEERTIALNPLCSLRDNMARMFHASDRGARGLTHLSRRRAETRAALAACTAGFAQSGSHGAPAAQGGAALLASSSGEECGAPSVGEERRVPSARIRPGRATPLEPGEGKAFKHVARFRSSDGFTLLRGKNAQGNQALLKLGQPYDLWLHALDGPSAHVIIRRSHAAEDIPEQSLLEAAVLVGEKSWQRHDAKAHIMLAALRHVHAIKGASPGTVKVDAVLRTLTVSLEESGDTLEE